MSDTGKQIDAIENVDDMEGLMKLETLLSREQLEQAGQSPEFAKAMAKPGDLLSGKTAETVARLRK